MANSYSDAITVIDQAQRPLIITHENADGDAVSSALALFLFFTRLGRKPTVIIDKAVPEALAFLPGADQALNDSFFPQDLIIRIDCAAADIDSLKWSRDEKGKNVNIIVTPKYGTLNPEQISFDKAAANFDSIFALDIAAISRMGKVYEKNKPLFDKLPVVNIDHHPDNPRFGKINIVEDQKSSTCEILYNILSQIKIHQSSLIDEDIATCLLAGIITDTGSFQQSNTRPETLQVAAELVRFGARRDEIIRHIYQTRQLSTLRLWGRVLSKMKIDTDARLAWSTISSEDLEWSNASLEERAGLIDDLMGHVSEADMILLFTDDGRGIRTSVRTKGDNTKAHELAALFGGGGHEKASGFFLPGEELENVEQKVVQKARELQKTGKATPVQKVPDFSDSPSLNSPSPTPNTDQDIDDLLGIPDEARAAAQEDIAKSKSVKKGPSGITEQGESKAETKAPIEDAVQARMRELQSKK